MIIAPPHISSLIIVAGISGAGRSSAIRVLEDIGFFTIDNLPPALFKAFLETCSEARPKYKHTALILDTDSEKKVEELIEQLHLLKKSRRIFRLIFLDADDYILLQRYNETRRPHPVYDPDLDRNVEDAIHRERELLTPLKEEAHVILDTSSFTIHNLKEDLQESIHRLVAHPQVTFFVNIVSFGFKHGIPHQCDLLVDVRFLKNPYFVEDLREKTGLNKEVYEYVLMQKEAQDFMSKYLDMINFLLPKYIREGKSYLTLCIGCTGGKHRSVSIANALLKELYREGVVFSVQHRDVHL